MTVELLDFYAAAALTGLLANPHAHLNRDTLTDDAFDHAQQMLLVRKVVHRQMETERRENSKRMAEKMKAELYAYAARFPERVETP